MGAPNILQIGDLKIRFVVVAGNFENLAVLASMPSTVDPGTRTSQKSIPPSKWNALEHRGSTESNHFLGS